MKINLSLLVLLSVSSLSARPAFLRVFSDQYEIGPNLQAQDCRICHARSSGGLPFNSYGFAVRNFYRANGFDMVAALASAEARDSDRDPSGASNLEEILADAAPGWTDGPNNTFWVGSTSSTIRNLPPEDFNFTLDAGARDQFAEYMELFFPGVTDPEIVGGDADPNGDGITNLVAYYLGTDPREQSDRNTPSISQENGRVVITHQSNQDATGITGELVFSESIGGEFVSLNEVATRIVLTVEGNTLEPGLNLNTYVIPEPEGFLFARIRVTQN